MPRDITFSTRKIQNTKIQDGFSLVQSREASTSFQETSHFRQERSKIQDQKFKIQDGFSLVQSRASTSYQETSHFRQERSKIHKSKIQNPRWFQSCSIQGINIIPRDVTFSTRKIHVIDACQAAQPFIQPGFSSAISGLVGLPLSLVAGATRWLRW